ncbi:MAG: hypothetical protein WCG94_07935, partial [Methanothrix sp.]
FKVEVANPESWVEKEVVVPEAVSEEIEAELENANSELAPDSEEEIVEAVVAETEAPEVAEEDAEAVTAVAAEEAEVAEPKVEEAEEVKAEVAEEVEEESAA